MIVCGADSRAVSRRNPRYYCFRPRNRAILVIRNHFSYSFGVKLLRGSEAATVKLGIRGRPEVDR